MATVSQETPVAAQSPTPKRKVKDENADDSTSEPAAKVSKVEADSEGLTPLKRGPVSKAREIRLEQNRKAARESRRRKKVMIEELQRSVIFFSRANGTLKHQNDELSRLLMSAQAHVAAIEGQQQTSGAPAIQPAPQAKQNTAQQAEAQAVATQAVYESQGFPAAAARAAAQTMNGSNAGNSVPQATKSGAPSSAGQALPPMQPGATMQAMANFQQAAAAAMQAAVARVQGVPGLNVQALTATGQAGNSQQTYDQLTAIAMQQAAAGQQFFQQNPFVAHPLMGWQGQGQPQQQAAPAPQAQPPATMPPAPSQQ